MSRSKGTEFLVFERTQIVSLNVGDSSDIGNPHILDVILCIQLWNTSKGLGQVTTAPAMAWSRIFPERAFTFNKPGCFAVDCVSYIDDSR